MQQRPWARLRVAVSPLDAEDEQLRWRDRVGRVRISVGFKTGDQIRPWLSLERGTYVALRTDTAGFLSVLTLAVLLAVVPGGTLSAQEEPDRRGWTFGLWMAGGYQWPTGRLANNTASDNPNLGLLQTVAELNPSPVVGGGVEVRFPSQELSARVGFEATSGAEVTGRIAICDLVVGNICTPQIAPVQVRSLTSVVRLLAGNPGARVRPVLSGGFGVRWFEFEIPRCLPRSIGDEALICRAVTDMYQDARPHMLLRAGIGLKTSGGPISVGLETVGTTGRYSGGSDRTDGNWYHDLRVEMSTRVSVY